MTSRQRLPGQWLRTIFRGVLAVGFVAGVIVVLLWLAGKFEPKVALEVEPPPAVPAPPADRVVPVRAIRVPLTETAVGSIKAVHETSIGSKLLARVEEVNLKAGQEVRQGEVLVRLDDSDLKARLQQAQAAYDLAKATHEQAVIEERRAAEMLQARAMSRQGYEQASTALRSAEASLRRAEEAINEVRATLDWATVRAPMDGRVIDKKVEVGDTVTPGQVLVTLFDPERMQLVANVRESLALRLAVGQEIGVRVDGLGKQCEGMVSEIVPQAASASRTFQVKVTGPCPPGIYSGMFGRILIPLEEETVLVVPQKAVRRIGQLELVDVVEEGRRSRRAIRTGRAFGDDVEVLSGLREGERVVVEGAEGESHHG